MREGLLARALWTRVTTGVSVALFSKSLSEGDCASQIAPVPAASTKASATAKSFSMVGLIPLITNLYLIDNLID